MTKADLVRLLRQRRYEDGDCTRCGKEPRGEGVLGVECSEKNNAPRRKKK
jgi:hypothetical protein